MKPVLGFIKEFQGNIPGLNVWVPWIGYIGGDDVYVVEFDENTAGIDMYDVKKIPPQKYIMFTGCIKLSQRNLAEPNYHLDSVIENPICYPDLTVDEIMKLRKDPRQIFKSLVGKTYEFQPFSKQI
jgi:hypothetical protein